ncbi:hypothetical protein [Mucilaginibacter sp. OK098]
MINPDLSLQTHILLIISSRLSDSKH